MMSQQVVEQLSDEQLLLAIASGDEACFEEIYDRYSPVLYAVCLRILRRPPDAQIVLSEVFWEVWHRANRFNPNRGKARTYLMTLVRSRAIDRLRSDAGRAARESEASRESQGTHQSVQERDDPARIAIVEENRQLVLKALGDLSDSQRETLHLAYFEGLTHREIADKLDSPLGSVKTHIRQGLIKLRQALRRVEG